MKGREGRRTGSFIGRLSNSEVAYFLNRSEWKSGLIGLSHADAYLALGKESLNSSTEKRKKRGERASGIKENKETTHVCPALGGSSLMLIEETAHANASR